MIFLTLSFCNALSLSGGEGFNQPVFLKMVLTASLCDALHINEFE